MPDVRKITAGGSYVATDAPVSVSAAGFQPPSADWFGQSQKLNKIVGGLKWASSSWNSAIELDRERADLPPVIEPKSHENYHMSGWTLGGVLLSIKMSATLALLAIIDACSSSSTKLMTIIVTPDNIQLKDRETRA